MYHITYNKCVTNVTKGTVPLVTFSRENVTTGTVPFVTQEKIDLHLS